MMNTDGLISYRRAKNADSEIIKAILFEVFQEYKIDGFTENINAEKSPGHDLALQKWI